MAQVPVFTRASGDNHGSMAEQQPQQRRNTAENDNTTEVDQITDRMEQQTAAAQSPQRRAALLAAPPTFAPSPSPPLTQREQVVETSQQSPVHERPQLAITTADPPIVMATDEEHWEALEKLSILELNDYDRFLLTRYRISSILESQTPVHLLVCPDEDSWSFVPGSLLSRRRLMDWWIGGVFLAQDLYRNRLEQQQRETMQQQTKTTERTTTLNGTGASSAGNGVAAEMVRIGNIPMTIHSATESEMYVSLCCVNSLRRWTPCFAFSYGGVFTRNNGSPIAVVFECPISGHPMRDLLSGLVLSDIRSTISCVFDALRIAWEKTHFTHGNMDIDHVYLTKLPGVASTMYLPTIVGYEQSGFSEHVEGRIVQHGPEGSLIGDMEDFVQSILANLDSTMQRDSIEDLTTLMRYYRSIRKHARGNPQQILARLDMWRERYLEEELPAVTTVGGAFRIFSRQDIDALVKWRLSNESEVEDVCRTCNENTALAVRRQYAFAFTSIGSLASLCESVPWSALNRVAARMNLAPGERKRKSRANILAVELARRVDIMMSNGNPERAKQCLEMLRRYLPPQSVSTSSSSLRGVSHSSA